MVPYALNIYDVSCQGVKLIFDFLKALHYWPYVNHIQYMIPLIEANTRYISVEGFGWPR